MVAQPEVMQQVDPRLGVELYRRMLLVRLFEEALPPLKREGLAKGPLHLCVGQEAVGIGATAPLRRDDVVTSTHRGHAHYLGKGADPRRLMAEILGRATGYGKGKAGHMLICDAEVGLIGGTGIVGGHIPVATGQALALKQRGTDAVVVSFFGDGAANEGSFHESLNLASLWKLPVVYVCENNLYGLTVPLAEHLSIRSVAQRAAAYDMPGLEVDGNDVVAVYQATAEAVARARRGAGPTLIEARTYRILGFSTGDQGGYQSPQELEHWRGRDPILLYGGRLQELGWLDQAQADQVRAEAEMEVQAAIRFARESPFPGPEVVAEDLWA
jgi:pyruvate dehydrogenase E1 component alpha subunit